MDSEYSEHVYQHRIAWRVGVLAANAERHEALSRELRDSFDSLQDALDELRAALAELEEHLSEGEDDD